MSFVSFLKKVGIVIVDAAGIYAGIGPLLSLNVPKASGTITTVGNDLTAIAGIITNVEATFAAVTSAPTGSLKLQAAIPQVSNLLQQALGLLGQKDPIHDTAGFNKGVSEITQGMVDVLNSLNSSLVSTSGGTNAVSPVAPAAIVPATLQPPAA